MAIFGSACKIALIAFLCLGFTEATRDVPKPNNNDQKSISLWAKDNKAANIDIGVAVSDNGNNGNQYGGGGYGNNGNQYGNNGSPYGNNGNQYGNNGNPNGNNGNQYGNGYEYGGNNGNSGNGYNSGGYHNGNEQGGSQGGDGIGIGIGNGGGNGIGIGFGGNGNGGYTGPGCCNGPSCFYGLIPQATETGPRGTTSPNEFDQMPSTMDEKSKPMRPKNENSGPRNSDNNETAESLWPRNAGPSPKAEEDRDMKEAHHGFAQDPQVQA